MFGTAAATVTAYIGNRYWTFRDRPDDDRRREMLLFLLISAIGMVIEVGSVWMSNHVLQMHGALWNNAAKFGVGLPLAGVFRFWTCHVFVFPQREAAIAVDVPAPAVEEPPTVGPQRVGADSGEYTVRNTANTAGL
jgi:hypothetical protein